MSARGYNNRDRHDGNAGSFAADDPMSRDNPQGETPAAASSHASSVGTDGVPDNDDLSSEDEEEISRYMANLLQRSQGSVAKAVSDYSYTPPRKEKKSVPQEQREPEQREPETDTSPTEEPPAAPPRREPAPEPKYDLSAMRELANFSAQSAISRFSHGQLVQMAYRRLAIAAMAIIAAFVLFHFSSANDGTLFALGGIAFVAAIVTSVRYITLARHLSRN